MVTVNIEYYVLWVIFVVLVALKLFALVDAISRKQVLYSAADKLNKGLWVAILVLSLALQVIFSAPQLLLGFPVQPLNLAGTVATCVYLADVRPAIRALRRY